MRTATWLLLIVLGLGSGQALAQDGGAPPPPLPPPIENVQVEDVQVEVDQQVAVEQLVVDEDGATLDDFGAEVREGDWRGALRAIWEARLFKAGDTSIHVNQLVIALIVLLIGLLVSRQVSRLVRYRLLKVKRIDTHAVVLIQRVVYYLLITIIVLLALPIAGIPITIFTVVGGAVAIGVGFGAQNLFNNLISSMIIMVERPIRIGDIIEVGGIDEGRVEDIGNRCTRVRRSDGMDVLVPNSHFLENPVVNWTLFDNHVRGSVMVGVAYGSPTDTVTELMLRVAVEHAKVREDPEPFVLFEEFGDNALTFRLMFWADITAPMQLRVICSDLHYKIDELFREADITISFPQRDIHLDTLAPLEVKMVGGQDN